MHVSRTFALAFSLVICSLFAVSPGHAQISIGISVDVEPPPLPVYDQPPIPAPGYLWVPGYWAWDDDTGYYWVPGTWVTPPVLSVSDLPSAILVHHDVSRFEQRFTEGNAQVCRRFDRDGT